MFVKSHGSAVLGIDALPIAAEVNITAGIGMYLVGLPITRSEKVRNASGPHSRTARTK